MILVRKLIALFRSRTLTAWLVGLFVIYYLTMAVWTGHAFAFFVGHLTSNALVQIFYVVFVLNTSLRAIGRVREGVSLRTAAVLLQLPLLVGAVLLEMSFFLSLNVRQVNWSPPLGEGDVIAVPWERRSYRIVSVEPALQKKALRTEQDKIFDYEPGVTVVDEQGAAYQIGAFPPAKVGSTFYHVLTFGVGPEIEVRDGSNMVWQGSVALRLVPFGNVDSITLPDVPFTFNISIIPNRFLQKGRDSAREYDLEHPRYLVEVVQGDKLVGAGETERSLSFAGQRSITFRSLDDWVLIEAVYDPLLPWFAGSIVLLVIGVPLFLLSYLFRPSSRAPVRS